AGGSARGSAAPPWAKADAGDPPSGAGSGRRVHRRAGALLELSAASLLGRAAGSVARLSRDVARSVVMEGDKPPLIIAAQEDEQIDAVASVLVRLRPAVVLTQTITDVDPEHHATASLV